MSLAIGAGLTILAGLAAWGYLRQAPAREPVSTQALRPIPWPDTAALDPADREQFDQLRRAVEELQQANSADPVALADAFGRLGQLGLAYGFFDAAEPALANALALAPDDPRWTYYLGYLYAQRKRLADAAALLERSVEIEPDNVAAMVHLGKVYRDLQRPGDAEQVLTRAIGREPETAAAHFVLGEIAFEAKDPQTAIEHWEAALALQPRASLVHRKLGEAYHQLQDEALSKAHMDARGDIPVALVDPRIVEVTALRRAAKALIIQGDSHMRAGHFQDAEDAFRRAVERDPDSVDARLNHGAALMQLAEPNRAAAEFEAVLHLDPANVKAHQNLGAMIWYAGQLDLATAEYEAALAGAPDDPAIHFALAILASQSGDCAKALEHFAPYLEANPNDTKALRRQVMCLADTGAYDQALIAAETGLRAHPGNAALLSTIIRLLAAAPDDHVRDGARAVRIAEGAGTGTPADGLMESLAMAYAEVGRFEDAILVQESAMHRLHYPGNRESVPLRPFMEANLAAYRSGRPARQPFAEAEVRAKP